MSRVPRNRTWQLDNLTTWQPDNLTLLSIDMKTKVVQLDNYHDDYYDYHDNYHDAYHNENHDYRDDYHDAWTLNLSHLVHLWKHCFPCLNYLFTWKYLTSNVIGLPVLVNKILSWFSLPYNFRSFSPQGRKKFTDNWGGRKLPRLLSHK